MPSLTATKPSIGVFSIEQDLHAHAVIDELVQRGHEAHLIATDKLAAAGSTSWWGPPGRSTSISTFAGELLDISTLDLVWWRRVNQPQAGLPEGVTTDDAHLISNEWRAAIAGAAFDSFSGIWVNVPASDVLAGNKLVQLRAAARVGFVIPRTIVSSCPADVLSFCESVGGEMVAKKLVGAPPNPLATIALTSAELEAQRPAIALCPTMYQELIRGREHLRINCFGRDIHSFLIESDHLDWRRDLTVPIRPTQLTPTEESQCRALLRVLGLRVAVIDAKRREDGLLVWIELNPQGQFLFCEALTGYELTRYFARFLSDTAQPRTG